LFVAFSKIHKDIARGEESDEKSFGVSTFLWTMEK